VVLVILKEPLEVDELAMPDEGCDFNLQVLRVEEGVLLVEIGDRDDDLIHAGVSEEDGELRLHLVRIHHVVVGWGDLMPLVLLVVRYILILSMHGTTQLAVKVAIIHRLTCV
jgi:hypothetical protein